MMKLERYSVVLNSRYSNEPLLKMRSSIIILHSYGDTVLYGVRKLPPWCVKKNERFETSWKLYKTSEAGGGGGLSGGGLAATYAVLVLIFQPPVGFQNFFIPRQWAEKPQTAFGDEVGGYRL